MPLRNKAFKIGEVEDYEGYIDFLLEIANDYFQDDLESWYNLVGINIMRVDEEMDVEDGHFATDEQVVAYLKNHKKDAENLFKIGLNGSPLFPEDHEYPVIVCYHDGYRNSDDDDDDYLCWYKKSDIKKY